MEAPPAHSRLFFQHSSAWILLLAVLGRLSHPILSVILTASAFASWMHWENFRARSSLAQVDRWLACAVILYVTVLNDSWLVMALTIVSMLLFECGRRAFEARLWGWHLVLHAWFRYSAFWAVCLFIHAVEKREALLWSVVYWGHLLGLFYNAK